MPRNSSGVYTLPVAAFVSGTVIKSADMNSDLSDIATALTQSLATTGVSAMTAPLPFVGGTVAAPGLGVAGNMNTGIYQVSTSVLGITAGGTLVAQYAASGVTIPTLLTISNALTLNGTNFTFGSTSVINAFLAALAQQYVLTFTIDGGGSVPSTGVKGYLQVPCGSTVLSWTITADQSGSAVVDVTKSTFAGFPPSSSIAGSEKPTLSAAQSNRDTNLTTWTTALSIGDILGFNLQSVTTCTRIQVAIVCKRNTQ